MARGSCHLPLKLKTFYVSIVSDCFMHQNCGRAKFQPAETGEYSTGAATQKRNRQIFTLPGRVWRLGLRFAAAVAEGYRGGNSDDARCQSSATASYSLTSLPWAAETAPLS
jgi:hypothetical protein